MLKGISSKLFKMQKYTKARKIFQRINESFKNRESAKNFCKEDNTTTEFKQARQTLDELELQNMTNLALCHLKEQNLNLCIDTCEKALTVDPLCHKAIFLKGRAFCEKQ